jgi:hypothetical protein
MSPTRQTCHARGRRGAEHGLELGHLTFRRQRCRCSLRDVVRFDGDIHPSSLRQVITNEGLNKELNSIYVKVPINPDGIYNDL